jgi:hypothetical protein
VIARILSWSIKNGQDWSVCPTCAVDIWEDTEIGYEKATVSMEILKSIQKES